MAYYPLIYYHTNDMWADWNNIIKPVIDYASNGGRAVIFPVPTKISADRSNYAEPPINWILPTHTSGAHDDYWEFLADRLASDGREVFVRLFPECNSDGNIQLSDPVIAVWPCQAGLYNGSPANRLQNETDYVNAYRHVVTLFRNRGATNVKFTFDQLPWPSGNAGEYGRLVSLHLTNMYPGDAYVDVVGLDLYNYYGTFSVSSYQNSLNRPYFKSVYNEMRAFTSRPFKISEIGAARPDLIPVSGKIGWLKNELDPYWIRVNYPDCEGVCLWDDQRPLLYGGTETRRYGLEETYDMQSAVVGWLQYYKNGY